MRWSLAEPVQSADIDKEFIVNKSVHRPTGTELEQLLLLAVARALEVPKAHSRQLAAWQVARVTQFIEDNLDTRIGVTELAAVTKLSRSHFARCFKGSFGVAPYSYVMLQRVGRARKLLASTTAPLTAVALDCGLVDQSHLTNHFRRYTGTTPAQWRRDSGSAPSAMRYDG